MLGKYDGEGVYECSIRLACASLPQIIEIPDPHERTQKTQEIGLCISEFKLYFHLRSESFNKITHISSFTEATCMRYLLRRGEKMYVYLYTFYMSHIKKL